MGAILHNAHALARPAAEAEANAADVRTLNLMAEAGELRAQLDDPSGIAAAIRKLRTINHEGAKTIIAALSSRVAGVLCDTEEMVGALDEAHDAPWYDYDSESWGAEDKTNERRQIARGN